MDGLVATLSRRHYQRLRFYWRGRKGQGGASRTDAIDLDLAARGWIARRDDSSVVYFQITPDGERELAAETRREVERRQPHHELGGRLAAWLRDAKRITWENIELRVEVERGGQIGYDYVRPDVFSLACTYQEKSISPAIHEVKVSRADFLADLAKPEKREGYMPLAERFFYAAPQGMIDPREIPDGCGLVEEIGTGDFKVAKQAPRRKVSLTAHHFMNLILKPGTANSFE